MGTRSVIKVEGADHAQVYKHWDGYPDHMMAWLEEFNASFSAHRGEDPDYKLAQLLRFSAKHAERFGLDNNDFTGWGVVPYDSDCGQDYTYVLRQDGSVDCYDLYKKKITVKAVAKKKIAEIVNSSILDLEQAKELITKSNGKIFTVTFTKKDGEIRKMNCRLGVSNKTNGNGLTYDPSDYNLITVFDMQAKAYRMVNLETVSSLNINKKFYEVK